MSTLFIKGNPKKGGIPRGAKVRVEALPTRHVVFLGTVRGGYCVVDPADPGKYVYSVYRFYKEAPWRNIKYVEEIYHEVTEEQYKKLQGARPRFMKGRLTSEGYRWRCQYPMCDEEVNTKTAAVLHEWDHFGVDPLKEDTPAETMAKAEESISALAAEQAKVKQKTLKELKEVAADRRAARG